MAELTALNTLDLVFQIAISLLLIYGFVLFRYQKNLRGHAIAFAVATLLNAVSVILLMLLPFFIEANELATGFVDAHLILLLVHHSIGLVVLALSLFIVLRWAMNGFKPKACRGKKLMYWTLITWAAALLLGITLYLNDSGLIQ